MPCEGDELYPDLARVISDIRAIGHRHGYAIASHGSLYENRDIDLVAVPWTKTAHARSTLLRSIGKLEYLYRSPKDELDRKGFKPHGRRSHIFNLRRRLEGTPYYVDLAVMPREQDMRARR